MAQPVLILVDIQQDYCPGGAWPLEQMELAVNRAQQALHEARRDNVPIIFVQHVALSPDATFFRAQTPGVRLHPAFTPRSNHELLIKHHANAFRNTDLKERLDGLGATDLVIAGMMTHMCIDSTVRAAADAEYAVTVLADATATRSLSFHDATVPAREVQAAVLAALDGSFANVVTTADWVNSRS